MKRGTKGRRDEVKEAEPNIAPVHHLPLRAFVPLSLRPFLRGFTIK